MNTKLEKKKILIFSLAYYPRFIGGAEVAIKEITDRLISDEYEFDMITLRFDSKLPKVEKVGNVTVYRVGYTKDMPESSDSISGPVKFNKHLMMFTGACKALQLHRKNTYTMTWSMMATYNSFAAYFFKLLKPKVPFLLTLQEGDTVEHILKRAKPVWPFFQGIFKRADHIQVISQFLSDFATETMEYKGGVTIVPNGVSYKHFAEVPEGLPDLKSIDNLPIKAPGDVWLVTTSRLVTKNAIGDMVTSLEFLPDYVKCIIAGDGYQMDDLKKMTKELNIESRVHFLGRIDHGIMPQLLKASDIFIRPSLSEGFGNSYIEAMATEIPVIATPVGGIVDFLFDGKTGYFCETENPKSIANTVQRILDNPEEKERVLINASNMVREKYDWDLVADQMKNVFNTVSV